MTTEPDVLILSSRNDFSCDYVVAQLALLGCSYLRLNTEDLPSCAICLDPLHKELRCKIKDRQFLITPKSLRSVWFRRSVYLRDSGASVPSTAEEQIARIQWAALVRGLMVFDRAKWFNNPGATYVAEQKPLQLSIAEEIGLLVPQTIITNDAVNAASIQSEDIAIKGVDTVIAYESGEEIFAFTTILPKHQACGEALTLFPATVQEAICPKTDIRVTIVENSIFAVSITRDGCGIEGDWRSDKADLSYRCFSLPNSVEKLCLELMRRLGLRFGAIDLARRRDDYFFLEINPTGEWAWLVDATDMKIDKAIGNSSGPPSCRAIF